MAPQLKSGWILLEDDPKSWSRLLYPNPVCFLCSSRSQCSNVMVLSWLTATNNEGEFMFSLNQSRHTARMLLSDDEGEAATGNNRRFVLCVPTAAQKELVLQVGSISGREGSKFPRSDNGDIKTDSMSSPLSKRQQKARLQSLGVPGLRTVPLPANRNKGIDSTYNDSLFYIDGTIAYLVCCIKQCSSLNPKHHLVVAQVERAAVQSPYWNATKRLFVSTNPRRFPPFLCFLGSQTFGCVVPDSVEIGKDDECFSGAVGIEKRSSG